MKNLQTFRFIMLVLLIILIPTFLTVILHYHSHFYSIHEILALCGQPKIGVNHDHTPFSFSAFIACLLNYYNSQVSTFTDYSLATGFPHSATQYYFPDLPIHKTKILFFSEYYPNFINNLINSNFLENNLFFTGLIDKLTGLIDNFKNNFFFTGLIAELKNAIIKYVIGTYCREAFPLTTWFPILDMEHVTSLINEHTNLLIDIQEDISDVEFSIQTHNPFVDADLTEKLMGLEIELNDCNDLINRLKDILANKYLPLAPILFYEFTGHLVTKYLTYLLAPVEFINTTDAQEKLEFYLSNFKQTHNLCLSLMSQFYMIINNGFLNTHLSLSQLNAIYKLVLSFRDNISSLNNSVGEFTLFLNDSSYYWDSKTGLTLFTTLYKYIYTFALEVCSIITNNTVKSEINLNLNLNLTSIIPYLSDPTTVAITHEKLRVISLIKTDLSQSLDLIKNLSVDYENNVTTVIGNLITNLNFKFGNRLYNGFGFATNYQEILTVISGINDNYSYTLNTYIPCIAGLTDKLWYHLICLYCYIYIPLLIVILILILIFLIAWNGWNGWNGWNFKV